MKKLLLSTIVAVVASVGAAAITHKPQTHPQTSQLPSGGAARQCYWTGQDSSCADCHTGAYVCCDVASNGDTTNCNVQ